MYKSSKIKSCFQRFDTVLLPMGCRMEVDTPVRPCVWHCAGVGAYSRYCCVVLLQLLTAPKLLLCFVI